MRARFFEDVERGMNRLIADGMDAHRLSCSVRGQHHDAQMRGVDGGPPAVAVETCVGVGAREPSGVLAGDPIEELLEPAGAQAGARIGLMQVVEPAHVVEQGGKQVDTAGQLTLPQQTGEDVVAHEIEPRRRHE